MFSFRLVLYLLPVLPKQQILGIQQILSYQDKNFIAYWATRALAIYFPSHFIIKRKTWSTPDFSLSSSPNEASFLLNLFSLFHTAAAVFFACVPHESPQHLQLLLRPPTNSLCPSAWARDSPCAEARACWLPRAYTGSSALPPLRGISRVSTFRPTWIYTGQKYLRALARLSLAS